MHENSVHIVTRAKLLIRRPRNVAQVEFSLLSGEPLFNSFFLSNLQEYHHKSYIAKN